MSDSVVISLIGAVSSTVLAAIAAVSSLAGQYFSRQAAKHTQETRMAVVAIEKNTNGIKDELVTVTAQANLAKGNLEGREQYKLEVAEAKRNGD